MGYITYSAPCLVCKRPTMRNEEKQIQYSNEEDDGGPAPSSTVLYG